MRRSNIFFLVQACIFAGIQFVAAIDPDICKGKMDENIYHPADCTKFVACSNERPREMECGACNPEFPSTCHDGKLVFTLGCMPDTPDCKPQYGQCVEADRAECITGSEDITTHNEL
ncbi:hypothetical protein BGZ76_002203 [Entomortierella beljakovae]|nr:hypothetical protein BGZ76_002203 [Entomortierella beljakovae]